MMNDISMMTRFIGEAEYVFEPPPAKFGEIPFVLKINGVSVEPQLGDTFVFGDDVYLYDGREVVPLGAFSATVDRSYAEPEEFVPKATNCCNCGAPLAGQHLCRYCDTWNH